jgi:hypothetical protein
VLPGRPDQDPTRPAGGVAVVPGRTDGLAAGLTGLAAVILGLEIAHRAPETAPEIYALEGAAESYSARLDGPPPVPLAPWDHGRADRLARTLGAVLVAGLDEPGEELRRVIDDLTVRGLSVEVVETGSGGPDPLWLAGRVYPGPDVEGRRELLGLTGVIPAGHPYLIRHFAAGAPGADVAVDGLAHRSGAVACDPEGLSSPLDVVAAVSGAVAVVTDQVALVVLAAALGRPAVLVRWPRVADPPFRVGPGAYQVDGADGIRSLPGEWPEPAFADWVDDQVAATESYLHEVAARLQVVSRVREARTASDVEAELRDRLDVLERVNAALRARLNREREAMVARIRAAGLSRPVDPAPPPAVPDAGAVRAAQAEAEALRQELDRLYSTKTMKVVNPLRRVYGAARSRLR